MYEDIQEYLKTLDKKTRELLYSTGISSIHKAIRMRMPEMAIAPTVISYFANNWRFTHRVLVCLMEDCTRDYEMLEWASNNFFEKMKTVEGAVEFVQKICSAYKGKEGNFFCDCRYECTNEKQIILNKMMLDKYVPHEIFEAYRIGAPISNLIEGFRNHGFVVTDWAENLLRICYEQGYEREGQGTMFPIFHNVDEFATVTDTYDLYSKNAEKTYDDLFLMNGIDMHTYVGKIVLNVAKKKGMLSFIKNEEDFGKIIWHLMPGSYRGLQKQKDGYCLTLHDKEIYITDEITNAWEKVADDFNGLRRWAMEKFLPEYVEVCKYVLKREKINFDNVKYSKEEVEDKKEIIQLNLF